MAKNRHQIPNRLADLGTGPSLHCNVSRPHDKNSILEALPENNRHPSLCEYIHPWHCLPTRSASRGGYGWQCTLPHRLLQRSQNDSAAKTAHVDSARSRNGWSLWELHQHSRMLLAWLRNYWSSQMVRLPSVSCVRLYFLINLLDEADPFWTQSWLWVALGVRHNADLQLWQANKSGKTWKGCQYVDQLQCIMGVARNELHDAQDTQRAEADVSPCSIDSAVTSSPTVLLDSINLPISYTNVNTTWCNLVQHYIWTYEIRSICRNALELDLPNTMIIYDTVNVSRFKVDHTDASRVTWCPLPPPVCTRHVGTSYVVQSVTENRPSSEGTVLEYDVKWEGWEQNDTTCEPEENMTKAKEMEKQ